MDETALLVHDQAAIDVQGLPGDVAAGVRREEDRCPGKIFRNLHAAKRNVPSGTQIVWRGDRRASAYRPRRGRWYTPTSGVSESSACADAAGYDLLR